MVNIPASSFYLWRRKSSYNRPWDRQFLNIDFLQYEKKRLIDVTLWNNIFSKAKIGEILDEVYYYVIPIELDSEFKAIIALKGNYNYFGLSALKNSLQMPLIMLLPKDKTPPLPYSFIRIIKSTKGYISNNKNNYAHYVLVADDYENIDSSQVYIVDVPKERNSVSNFIKENIIDEDILVKSFQPTISSAPYVANSKGGISLSTFMKSSTFSEEFFRTLKMMQPPEFSDIQTYLPPAFIIGQSISLSKGMTFQVAERSVSGKNFFNAFSSFKYDILNIALSKRDIFNGEYSVACALNPRGDDPSDLMKDILSKFVKTDISQPFNVDELKLADLDLSRTQRNITEDLWIQIAKQRQSTPSIYSESKEIMTLRNEVMSHWETIFESIGLQKNREHEMRVYAGASLRNILRVAQSIARDENKERVASPHLEKSFKLFIDNSYNLIHDPQIQHYATTVIPQMYETAKFNALRAELSTDSLGILNLFNNLKDEFRDVQSLQQYVDKLVKEGYVWEPRQGIYKWV